MTEIYLHIDARITEHNSRARCPYMNALSGGEVGDVFELGELRAEVAALKQQLASSAADAGDDGGGGGARAVSPPKEMVDDMQVLLDHPPAMLMMRASM